MGCGRRQRRCLLRMPVRRLLAQRETGAPGPDLASRLGLLLMVVGALTAAGAAFGVGPQSLQLAVFLAVVLAFSLPWQVAIGPIAILAGTLFLVPRVISSWSTSDDAWIALLGAGGACVFGRYIMEQRRVAHVLEQRTHELEINEERNRMARDMHGHLGHSLTVIALKTELASRLVDTAPDQVKAELTEVQSLARSAWPTCAPPSTATAS